MKKQRVILDFIIVIALGVSAWFISLGIVRAFAKAFAEPNPYKWEWVYISTSPRAYSYHQSGDCKYLRGTNYNIEFLSVHDADDAGRTPCSHCLEESRRHQYDSVAWYVLFPVFLLLVGVVALIERFFNRKRSKENGTSKSKLNNVAYPEKVVKAQLKLFNNHNEDRKTWFVTLMWVNDAINELSKSLGDTSKLNEETTKRAINLAVVLSDSGFMGSQIIQELNKLVRFVDNNDDAVTRKIIRLLADTKESLLFSISMKYVNKRHQETKKMMYDKEKEDAIHQANIDEVNKTIREIIGR